MALWGQARRERPKGQASKRERDSIGQLAEWHSLTRYFEGDDMLNEARAVCRDKATRQAREEDVTPVKRVYI